VRRIKQFIQAKRSQNMKKNEVESKKAILEEIFNDLYSSRPRIYKLNFVRGIMFGAGSAVGGTLVLALIVWILSLFVNVPVIGDLFENAQQSIERTTDEASDKDRN
jgi:hypothetical protein